MGIGGRTANSDPLYVLALDAKNNQIVAGTRHHLARHDITIHHINDLDLARFTDDKTYRISAKYRSTMQPVPCRIAQGDNGSDCLRIIFADPQYGISPGQACVLYDDVHVIGGGWIVGEKENSFTGFSPKRHSNTNIQAGR
ncbi:MAG: aminomethyltransferase beta-barrel domain-containing protein [Pseudomonadota bacterium]